DEGLGTLSCGSGACANTVPACVGGAAQTCSPRTGSAEVCNGLDDNCNGAVDEGLGTLSCGSGACANTVQACLGGATQTCSPRAGSAEVCNGIDDNCNGAVDEGLGTVSCGLGACTRSVAACSGGAAQACSPGAAVAEICFNGIDDNCNGAIDEGCATCTASTLTWNIPAGTAGGPSCITTGGGTCTGAVSCSGSSCYDSRACGLPHCNTLRCNDGSYTMSNYCSVIAACSGGTAVATGFSW
ncbi:MAG: MopE-related protein, partial [Deltaproteobacteria bacterium]